MPRKTRKPSDKPPSIDQLIEGFSRVERLIFVDSDSFRIVRHSDETASFGPYRTGERVEEVMARKGDMWWIEERLAETPRDNPHPLDARYFISRGHTILNCTYHRDTCGVVPFDDGWNMFSGWEYFTVMGYDANRYMAESGGADYQGLREQRVHGGSLDHPYLPEFLQKNHANYHVMAAPEAVDGFRCWVVEWPGMDKLWVDVEHGFGIRRRMYHWTPGGPLKYEISQGDFREATPGLWMPFHQTIDKFTNDMGTTQVPRRVFDRSVYHVTELQLGAVSASRFAVRLPARTSVFDTIRDLRYCVVGEGHDPFDGPPL